MSNQRVTEDHGHDRLTLIAEAAIEAIEDNRLHLHGHDRAIVILVCDNGDAGTGLMGYDQIADAFADALTSVQSIAEAGGIDIAIVPMATRGQG